MIEDILIIFVFIYTVMYEIISRFVNLNVCHS